MNLNITVVWVSIGTFNPHSLSAVWERKKHTNESAFIPPLSGSLQSHTRSKTKDPEDDEFVIIQDHNYPPARQQPRLYLEELPKAPPPLGQPEHIHWLARLLPCLFSR